MSGQLRQHLAQRPAVLAPGVYDPLSALLAEQAGFDALYLSGAAIAYTQLGRPANWSMWCGGSAIASACL
jgi:2-methylisocitrate lyase-like PEP mutase family enzyme